MSEEKVHARVERGEVQELFGPSEIDPATVFPDSFQWVVVPSGMSIGQRWVYVDGGFKPPLKPAVTLPSAAAIVMGMAQQYMDSVAKDMHFLGIADAISYADETAIPHLQAQGLAFRKWRSMVRDECEKIAAAVQGKEMDLPSFEGLIAAFPPLPLD
ncbi:hypothetical protein [Achromobacter aegrifaciens]